MTVNFMGKEYSSVDEMPADVRTAYDTIAKTFADADHDGVPDIFEGKGNAHILNLHSILMSQMQSGNMIFDGKEISGIDQLPPEVRAKYETALEKMRTNPALKAIVTMLASKALSNANDLPPEVREKYKQVLEKMQANPNLSGLTEGVEPGTPLTSKIPTQFSSASSSLTPSSNAPPKSFLNDTAMFLIGLLLVIVFLIAIGVAAFLLLGPMVFK